MLKATEFPISCGKSLHQKFENKVQERLSNFKIWNNYFTRTYYGYEVIIIISARYL